MSGSHDGNTLAKLQGERERERERERDWKARSHAIK